MTTAVTIVCSVIAIDALIMLFMYASHKGQHNDDYLDEE